ncbi:U3 small nucleolar RNA-associated protein 23 [Kwoniella heveanensis CBS 569]|nr:U3 small nucleolar RNA-associated protein 23 [Kwoniella heveanensis CBS 569]
MRQKRAKTYKRVMALYTQTFNFRQPFQILVSHDLLLEGAKSDLNMHKQFLTVVQGECKPMITQCCMEALYKVGKDVQRTTDLAKTFERRKCNHREPLEPDECLKDVIGSTNKHRYVLASSSSALRVALQVIPGLPIIHFNPRGVLVLSPPSTATIRAKNKLEEERRVEGSKEMEGVVDGENVVGAPTVAAGSSAATVGSRKKAKGVNPLSVKKKKKAPPVTSASAQKGRDGEGKKRRRDENDDQEEGAIEAPAEGGLGVDEEGGQETVSVDRDSLKKKKRKRSKKSAVKDAIAALEAEAKLEADARAGLQAGSSGSDEE